MRGKDLLEKNSNWQLRILKQLNFFLADGRRAIFVYHNKVSASSFSTLKSYSQARAPSIFHEFFVEISDA